MYNHNTIKIVLTVSEPSQTSHWFPVFQIIPTKKSDNMQYHHTAWRSRNSLFLEGENLEGQSLWSNNTEVNITQIHEVQNIPSTPRAYGREKCNSNCSPCPHNWIAEVSLCYPQCKTDPNEVTQQHQGGRIPEEIQVRYTFPHYSRKVRLLRDGNHSFRSFALDCWSDFQLFCS